MFLALDQGSHASRALVFDSDGNQLASAEQEITTQRPEPGHVEHDPDAVVASVHKAASEALQQLENPVISAVGLATQRSSMLCWDRNTGQALSPVLSWQDVRATRLLRPLMSHADEVRRITGLHLSPHYGAGKLCWCLEELPAVRSASLQQTLAAGPLSSYLIAHLTMTRPALVDPCNASRTLLYDVHQGRWSKSMLDMFEIDESILPRCRPNLFEYGELQINGQSIPLRAVTGDQSAALFVEGAPDAHTVYLNAGTGAFLHAMVDDPEHAPEHLLGSVVLNDGQLLRYAAEATVNGAAAALDWMAGLLNLPPDMWRKRLSAWIRACKNPPLFLNGVAGLGAPYWLSSFESRLVGEAKPGACMVAALESVVFLIQRNLAEFRGRMQRVLVTGGLAQVDVFCQLLADLSGIQVSRSAYTEATARGVAWLAGGRPEHWNIDRPTLFTPKSQPGLENRYRRWLVQLNNAVRQDIFT